jgi:predicted DNA-binding protein
VRTFLRNGRIKRGDMAGKKNSNIMSVSGITPEFQDRLKVIAEKRGLSVSKMVRDILEKHFPPNGDVFTLVFTVPFELKGDEEKFKEWMVARSIAVVEKMTKE